MDALSRLERRFCDRDTPDDAYRKDGPVAVARFEDDDVPVDDDPDAQNRRILRQRRAAAVIATLILPLLDRPRAKPRA